MAGESPDVWRDLPRGAPPPLDRQLRTRVSLRPGRPGTKELQERYGDRLVCVRHRYDEQNGRSFKTVELIVEETPWKLREHPNAERIVRLRLERQETRLRYALKGAGGGSNPQKRVWELRQDRVTPWAGRIGSSKAGTGSEGRRGVASLHVARASLHVERSLHVKTSLHVEHPLEETMKP